ncbi:6285_t:CDS:2 [Funneliformis caledonium]|uniref:6285_t:CDS:1 n=1 Tax=Funneliformis caledonium TaxID=1117310 RepID=A0A9N9DM77_9GLOM|nr:6285_t:CDS:2 [Funneliformis caledonium]
MSNEQFKIFRDEVVLTLKEFDKSLMFDHKQQWSDISQHVSRNIMPTINRH